MQISGGAFAVPIVFSARLRAQRSPKEEQSMQKTFRTSRNFTFICKPKAKKGDAETSLEVLGDKKATSSDGSVAHLWGHPGQEGL